MIFGKHINRYYLKYALWLILGLAALVLVDYVQLLVPQIYRTVINGINHGTVSLDGKVMPFDMDFLLDYVCLPMIIIILSLVVGRFVWRICFFGTGVKVETDLRQRMFGHCKELSQQYYQKNKVGGMMSLFTNDLETVQDCFGSGILMFFDALCLGGLAIIKMWSMNRILTLLSLIPMIFLFAAALLVGKYMMKKWEVRQQAFSNLSDFSQESFSGISVIKAFVCEARELMAFRRLNRDNEKANVDYTKISVLLNILVALFVESVICVILGYGGYLAHEKIFDAGQLVEFIGYFTAIVWPVMAISQLIEMGSRGKASLSRISELLDAKVDVCDRSDVSDPGVLTGNIEFRGLSFKYPYSENNVLHNVSFKINAGENVGIVGRTGSGKTTVVDLLLRTYSVADNTIFLDGHDINSIPIKTVRKYFAYVPQDNYLFSDTIENNISFASDVGGTEEVIKAAKLADVHDNITEFTDGYKTILGERGVTVSGGQKQRISIARALMKNASILILDDSVSAVDTATEKAILDRLHSTRKNKTTIVIAHRMSTVEHMDKIIFFDDGHIGAVGTHRDLYTNCCEYRRMVDLQKLDEERQA